MKNIVYEIQKFKTRDYAELKLLKFIDNLGIFYCNDRYDKNSKVKFLTISWVCCGWGSETPDDGIC